MYRYRDSGLGAFHILIVTKKGQESGGLPKGIIIPIGYYYTDKERILDFAKRHRLYSSMVRHMPGDETLLTEICPGWHYVDRFGMFLSREKSVSVWRRGL